MTDELRGWIKRRRAIFWKEKKTKNWTDMRDKIAGWIEERKKGYYLEMKEKMLAGDARAFFSCVNTLKNGANKSKWSPRLLYPGANDHQVAESLADYFNAISSEYNPLDRSLVPTAYSAPLPLSLIHI